MNLGHTYLRNTLYFGLEFKKKSEQFLLCFVDSDWGNDMSGRKSVTGFLFKIFNNTIIWCTR